MKVAVLEDSHVAHAPAVKRTGSHRKNVPAPVLTPTIAIHQQSTAVKLMRISTDLLCTLRMVMPFRDGA